MKGLKPAPESRVCAVVCKRHRVKGGVPLVEVEWRAEYVPKIRGDTLGDLRTKRLDQRSRSFVPASTTPAESSASAIASPCAAMILS